MKLLLATDFDGTIADIRVQPGDARIADDVLAFFVDCIERREVAIAIISGRDLDDLGVRTGGIAVWRAGSHGLEIAAPDGRVVRRAEPFSGAPSTRWEADAVAAGFRIERKKFGLALHWRGVADLTEAHPLVCELRSWALERGLTTIDGRSVLEARVPGPSKRDALEYVALACGATTVSYAGDDVTDHAALEWSAERGSAFLMMSAERPDVSLPGVVAVRDRAELLGRWVALVATFCAKGSSSSSRA